MQCGWIELLPCQGLDKLSLVMVGPESINEQHVTPKRYLSSWYIHYHEIEQIILSNSSSSRRFNEYAPSTAI